jgi:streptomycin 6-kinase
MVRAVGPAGRARPGLLSAAVVRRAGATIAELGRDPTVTMLHGDLHAGNVLAGGRERWLAIDPKGWEGTAAYDAFTVVVGHPAELVGCPDLPRAIRARVRRFAGAAGVDNDLALACCQARATSALLYQDIAGGDWFGRDLIAAIAELR